MLSLNILYDGKNKLINSLADNNFTVDDVYFVRIYTAIYGKQQAVKVAKEIKSVLPNSQIMGSSASGIIFEGKQYDEQTLVIIEKYDKTEVMINRISFKDKNACEVAKELKGFIKGREVALIHTLCGSRYPDVHNFIEEFNKTHQRVKLIGGVVGDILCTGDEGYVFTDEGVFEDSLLTASLFSRKLKAFSGSMLNHDPISKVYTINECDGSIISTIDGMPAVKWCEEQFGIEKFDSFDYDWEIIVANDALVRFQLILEGHGGASRFIRYDEKKGKMSLYFSKLSSGTKFRIGYTNPTKCVKEAYELCNKIAKVPVESIFAYSCLFRKMYLGNCAQWELSPFLSCNISGAFMMGEIAHINGKNEFLNGACNIVAVAESDKRILPDFAVFENVREINDDNEELLNFVLKKQSLAITNENQKLLEKLMRQQQKNKELLYIDSNTGMNNSVKYSVDNDEHKFDKMCMIQVDNAQLLISRLGQKHYYEILRKAVDEMKRYVIFRGFEEKVYYYILNDNTIFLTASQDFIQDEFLDMVKNLYENYQFINLGTKNELLINRFVVIKGVENMLERAVATLQNTQNLQTHFIICDDKMCSVDTLSDEMGMLYVINSAIANGKIIPYFQAIHDNLSNSLVKYEALMRIEDEDGRIYTPGEFMEIAKKYHLYSALSKIMIEKVLDRFSDTEIVISINLSVYDINYDVMREFIFDRLDNIKDASNFIFEILEDENFKDIDSLKKFIDRARQYGVKIAIDDFGNGYSNFMEIAKIEPDYIKVDASIIKDLDNSSVNQKVLQNIAFLGDQLGAQIVAEFVETQSIQNKLTSLNIRYSQGYFFSTPKPFSTMDKD